MGQGKLTYCFSDLIRLGTKIAVSSGLQMAANRADASIKVREKRKNMFSLFKTTLENARAAAVALVASAAVFAVTNLAPSPSSATVFQYSLSDHPDGGLANPTYGLRLDGLFGGDSNDFTFSFNTPGTSMTLLYDDQASTVRIAGRAYGGIDTGSSWDSNNVGFVDIDFTYRQNIVTTGSGTIGTATADVGVRTTGHDQNVVTGNSGTITLATGVQSTWTGASGGDEFTMVDQQSGGYSFKFNNFDDHRLGAHAGFAGPDTFVGWGWVNHWESGEAPRSHVYASDWLFTGTYIPPITNTEVPEPGTLILFGLGIAGLAVYRRRERKTA